VRLEAKLLVVAQILFVLLVVLSSEVVVILF
jgi:hypothetical protein